MISSWLSFFINDVVGGCVNYLANFYIFPDVSLLDIIIVSAIAILLLVSFVPRARSF